jgi:hypothetical protein
MDPNARISDALVSVRQFVGTLNGALNDQSYAGHDGVAYNPTGQFQQVGPTSTAVEGKPAIVATVGGFQVTAPMVLIALGAVGVVFALRHKVL